MAVSLHSSSFQENIDLKFQFLEIEFDLFPKKTYICALII